MTDAERDRREAFLNAGVYSKFHNTGLKDVEGAGELLSYVQSNLTDDLAQGDGVRLVGHDARCEDALMHLTKSILVRGYNARAYTLGEFCEELNDDDPDVWGYEAILLSCFDDPHFEQNPLPAQDQFRVANTLILLLRQGVSLSVHWREEAEWWPDRLKEAIKSSTKEFSI